MKAKINGTTQIQSVFSMPNIPNNSSTGNGYFQNGQLLICFGMASVAAGGATTTTVTFAKAFAEPPVVVTVNTDANLWYAWVQARSATTVGLRQSYPSAALRVTYIAIGQAA